MSIPDWANTIYGYFFVVTTALYGIWKVFQHAINTSVKQHIKNLHEEFRPIMDCITEMDKRTTRIEYALYNDGKTGLINKVEELLENQQLIKVDVEVMKAKVEA